jgi:hypothetical protein
VIDFEAIAAGDGEQLERLAGGALSNKSKVTSLAHKHKWKVTALPPIV